MLPGLDHPEHQSELKMVIIFFENPHEATSPVITCIATYGYIFVNISLNPYEFAKYT